MFQIGPYCIDSRVVLAPMAGITDQPFRYLCRQFGAGLTVSEMVTSDTRLWGSTKSRQRLNHGNDGQLRSVQIVGADPEMMACAARENAELGAQIIDINMGCPAKKVCKKAAGSALLRDEKLVESILRSTVAAVDVPVTLKIRTGWDMEHRNATSIAKIAQDCGIQALTVHGRTRACRFKGNAEYDTIASVVDCVSIPVIANGDITSPQKARRVLDYTGANAAMIGRAAQGKPWIFREVNHFLRTGELLEAPTVEEVHSTLSAHLRELYSFYGDFMGVRIARKHTGWYLKSQSNTESFLTRFNQIENAEEQHASVQNYFEQLKTKEDQAA